MSFTIHGEPGFESYMIDAVRSFCGQEPVSVKQGLKHEISEGSEVLHAGEGPLHYKYGSTMYTESRDAIKAIARAAKQKTKTIFGDSAEASQRLAYFLDAVEGGVQYDRAVMAGASGSQATPSKKSETTCKKGEGATGHCKACDKYERSEDCPPKCCKGEKSKKCSSEGPCDKKSDAECCDSKKSCDKSVKRSDCESNCRKCCHDGCCNDECCCRCHCCHCHCCCASGPCAEKTDGSCCKPGEVSSSPTCSKCPCCGQDCIVKQLEHFRGCAPSGYPFPAGMSCAPQHASPLKELDPVLKNRYLQEHTYLFGEKVTVGDVIMACEVMYGIYTGEAAGSSTPLPKVSSLVRMPKTVDELHKVFPHLGRLCTTLSKDSKLSPYIDMKDMKPKGFSKNKPSAPAGAPGKVFPWDEFKKLYSNSDDFEGTVMKFLHENFDNDRMVIYKMTYEKMADECKVGFVTSNQLKGFMQRFDPSFRKSSFAQTYVIGEGSEYDIVGLWIVEGDKDRLPDGIMNHPSWEFSTWQVQDLKKDKATIEDFLKAGPTVMKKPVECRSQWK